MVTLPAAPHTSMTPPGNAGIMATTGESGAIPQPKPLKVFILEPALQKSLFLSNTLQNVTWENRTQNRLDLWAMGPNEPGKCTFHTRTRTYPLLPHFRCQHPYSLLIASSCSLQQPSMLSAGARYASPEPHSLLDRPRGVRKSRILLPLCMYLLLL